MGRKQSLPHPIWLLTFSSVAQATVHSLRSWLWHTSGGRAQIVNPRKALLIRWWKVFNQHKLGSLIFLFPSFFYSFVCTRRAFNSFLIVKCAYLMPTVSLLPIALSWVRDPCVQPVCTRDTSQHLLSLSSSSATHSFVQLQSDDP